MRLDNRCKMWLLCVCSCVSITGCTQATPDAQQISSDQDRWAQLTSAAQQASRRGDQALSEDLYKQAMSAAQSLGPDNDKMAKSFSNLADFYYAQGDGDKADQLYSKALKLKEQTLGTQHADLVADLLGLARLKFKQGNNSESLALYKRAISILKKSDPKLAQDIMLEYRNAGGH